MRTTTLSSSGVGLNTYLVFGAISSPLCSLKSSIIYITLSRLLYSEIIPISSAYPSCPAFITCTSPHSSTKFTSIVTRSFSTYRSRGSMIRLKRIGDDTAPYFTPFSV